MSNSNFSKQMRLLQASEFERVFAARNSAGNAWLALFGAANDIGHARLGITVSKRVGGAVERNRWKRLLREAFRLSCAELPSLDFVCVVRAPAPPKLHDLMEVLQQLANRINGRVKKNSSSAKRPTS